MSTLETALKALSWIVGHWQEICTVSLALSGAAAHAAAWIPRPKDSRFAVGSRLVLDAVAGNYKNAKNGENASGMPETGASGTPETGASGTSEAAP